MADAADQNKRPEDTAFKQQRLRAWQPLLTPKWVIGTFAVTGVIFLLIGIIMVTVGDGVLEEERRYDNNCSGGVCTTEVIKITENYDGPIFFYYKLTNFFQNHRRFVKSRDDKQLRGKLSDLDDCTPLITADGDSKLLYPCGLVANSFFNDKITASLTPEGGSPTTLEGDSWDSSNIIWSSDKTKFASPEGNPYLDTTKYTRESKRDGEDITLPQVTDPDLIVWMRTAGLPTFKKLYRIRKEGLKVGDELQFSIEDNFNVTSFGGTKSIVVGTASALGGKNVFLSWAYVTVGILCLVASAAFAAKQIISPRKPGDLTYWEKNHAH